MRVGWLLLIAVVDTLFFGALGYSKPIKTLELSLKDAEAEALKSSHPLKAAQSEQEAARKRADAQFALLLPRISLDASYRYLGVIPEIPIQGGQLFAFTTHSAYSIGPTLNFTLWDTGSSRKAYQGYDLQAKARSSDRAYAEQQVLLGVRIAYIRVQLAVEELLLVSDTLKVSEAHYLDIDRRFRAGSSSLLDRLSSHRNFLSYQLQFLQRQADLASALEDLLDLTGLQDSFASEDMSAPSDPRIPPSKAVKLPAPSLWVKVDSLSRSLKAYEGRAFEPPGSAHPLLRSQELSAEATQRSSESIAASLWPTVQLSARTALDYPNGPVAENINQNTVALSLKMPLWDWKRTRNLSEQPRLESEAVRSRRQQTRQDLLRDWRKGAHLLRSLREQAVASRLAEHEASRQAKLSYSSYLLGQINLLDVQNADLQALIAKVESARIRAQMLSQLVQLEALSARELAHE